MHIALTERGLLVEREFPVEVFFHGHQIGLQRIDMLVEGRIIVETKAAHRITEGDRRGARDSFSRSHKVVLSCNPNRSPLPTEASGMSIQHRSHSCNC